MWMKNDKIRKRKQVLNKIGQFATRDDSQNMSGLTTLKTVAFVSAVSSACQGLIWSALSLPAILCYACSVKPDPITKTSELTYTHYLAAYFQGRCNEDLDIYKNIPDVTPPSSLLVFSIFVYIFSLLQAVGAITVIIVIATSKRRLIIGWLIYYLAIGYSIAIIDFVASAYVATDYDQIRKSPLLINRDLAGLTILSVLLVTCRGFFLWIANLFFYLYLTAGLLKTSCEKDKKRPDSTTPFADLSDASFQFDRNKMERPIEYVERSREKVGHEYPEHCAYSRWPRLHPGNRLPETKSRPSKMNEPHQLTHFEQYPPPPRPNQQADHKLQRRLQSFRDQNRPIQFEQTPPPRPTTLLTDNKQTQRQLQSFKPETRPGSLQEAILTVRPLRQVRPNISLISDSYP